MPADAHHQDIVTVTLVIVIFSILVFGGGTFPLLKLFQARPTYNKTITMSKTDTIGNPMTADKIELQTQEQQSDMFARWDDAYFIPFFRSSKPTLAEYSKMLELQDLATNSNIVHVATAIEDDDDDNVEGKSNVPLLQEVQNESNNDASNSEQAINV